MKVFHCDSCRHLIFFENTNCLSCGHVLAFVPERLQMEAMQPEDVGSWRSLARNAVTDKRYRLCANYEQHAACNWVVDSDDPEPLCLSCRLNEIIPDLSIAQHLDRWKAMEAAKRRVVYTLLSLKLPIVGKADDPVRGLAFKFLADVPGSDFPVLTGHEDGLITINIAEADDAQREKRRTELHEPYRTLVGHFRHEIGHYYWDVLVKDAPALDDVRRLFGDETIDYAEALKRHYEQGAPADWQNQFISTYASSHPWEDWAETWAHLLHMVDTLETAASCGVSVEPRRAEDPSLERPGTSERAIDLPLSELNDRWHAITYVINSLSRSLGQRDGYPFVLSGPVVEKIGLVRNIVTADH